MVVVLRLSFGNFVALFQRHKLATIRVWIPIRMKLDGSLSISGLDGLLSNVRITELQALSCFSEWWRRRD